MKSQVLTFGQSQAPILILDDFSGALQEIRALGKSLAPFPAERTTRYPGLRRLLLPSDPAGFGYVARTVEACVPFIGEVFGFKGFSLQEASFSMVTTAPESLLSGQKAPHFDQTHPGYLAVLHYLSDTPGSGTAFYRHRATGIEQVTEGNRDAYSAIRQSETEQATHGYMSGSTSFFERTGFIEGVADRLIIYQGNLLHSGIIPEDMVFSEDPLIGRLTGNIFVRGQ
ncbi:DUF6445 family protein [Asticcacaulis benevestitus]|uniref:Uncharacterized protein n=1 Tax=Asticcacaulis benevestitus DSM 16100 = ATCC BAA-896 TaxID=1121022 RepID=V4PBR4_9CAUL|nr:DUF6445 family protein [Asticcacaulis benevestitus]ESQ85541.1 hypothetical protein ABENE_18720 [Asticcacaulis benevestitus DSM 16100 = ATCC BAA-896]